MKQLQLTVPRNSRKEIEEVLADFSEDVFSSEVEEDGETSFQFTVTVDSGDIDELTEELKSVESLESGDLSIRVLEQESLIQKGQETKGSSDTLSRQEIYSRAQEFSGLDRAQWGLIAVSSAMAAIGLALDNLIVVIGAMMVAPVLSPFVSSAVGMVMGDRRLLRRALMHGGLGLVIAVAAAYVVVLPFPVSLNPVIEALVSSSIPGLVLSLLVGSAAALSFSTGLRDQFAGVAVAIALVPPLAAVGIGLKMMDPMLVSRSAAIVSINILAVIFSGSLTFQVLGLRPETYYKKKRAGRYRKYIPAALLLILILSIPAIMTSYQDYRGYVAEQRIENQARDYFGNDLLEISFDDSEAVITVYGSHNISRFREKTSGSRKVKVRELKLK